MTNSEFAVRHEHADCILISKQETSAFYVLHEGKFRHHPYKVILDENKEENIVQITQEEAAKFIFGEVL